MLLILFQKFPTVSGITGEKDREQIRGNLEAGCHVVLLLERAAAHPRNGAARTQAMAEGHSAYRVRELPLA